MPGCAAHNIFAQFQFPPPLNSHVYPTPIFIIGCTPTGMRDLALEEFGELFTKISTKSTQVESIAMYDVPAISTCIEEDVDELTEDEEDYDESDNNEEEIIDSSADDWDEDEEITDK